MAINSINGEPILPKVDNLILPTVTRNGSAGNPANPNAIAVNAPVSVTVPYYKFFVDAELQDGYEYYWVVRYNNGVEIYRTTEVPYVSWTVDTDEYNTIQVGVFMRSKSDANTYYPLRVADLGTDAIHIIPVNVPIGYESDVITPSMRNGSLGNTANANMVAMYYVQPMNGVNAVRVTTDIELGEGQSFRWVARTYSAYGQSTVNTPLCEYDPYLVSDKSSIEIVNDGTFVGFAVALGIVNSDGSFSPIRVANVGDCLTCRWFYDSNHGYDNDSWNYVPPLKNGSLGNVHNTDFVSMDHSIDTRDATAVMLSYEGELADGESPMWVVDTLADAGKVRGSATHNSAIRAFDGTEYSKSLYGNNYLFKLQKGEKAIMVGVAIRDSSGFTPLRVNTDQNCIRLRFLYGETDSGIVSRNKDVLPAVYASSKYGWNAFGTKNKYKGLSMLVSTDVHRCVSQMGNAIDYLNAIDSIDCGICLGDMAAINYAESDGTWYTSIVNGSHKPFYTVIGNHDGGNSASSYASGTKAQQFDKWIRPTLDVLGISDLTTTYYKVDFANYPVTLIVIDNYDVPDTVDSSGDFSVSRGVEAISQAQIDWLTRALADVPSGNHLIVARHSCGCASYNTVTDAVFTQPDKAVVPSQKGYESDAVIELVEAWRNGGSVNVTLDPASAFVGVLPSLSVNADFSSRGTGVFACYVGGHTHWDVISRDSEYGQLFVTLAATANDNWQNKESDLPRATGSKAEDCLTVVSLDTENRKVNLVRVGSNVTTAMTERVMESISY